MAKLATSPVKLSAFPPIETSVYKTLPGGDEGFLLSMGYSIQRGFGSTDPFVGEIRTGEVALEVVPEELGFPIEIGRVEMTECQMVNQFKGSATEPPQFTRAYGPTFGHNERKAMSMALVDRALRGRELGEPVSAPARDGRIAAIQSGNSQIPAAEDLERDYLIPGLIELRTDHLESHSQPRPSVQWPSIPAVIAHDAQIAASGITTVYDSICVGVYESRQEFFAISVEAVREAKKQNLLRADHYLHIRREVVEADVVSQFEPFHDETLLGLVSLTDHTRGQRRWADLNKHRTYYGWRLNLSDDELEKVIQERMQRRETYARSNCQAVIDLVKDRDVVLGSHDDTEREHVEEAVGLGLTISEFPTTVRAAEAAREHGLDVIMGSPNLVLGGSHSGNVSAIEPANQGLRDALASDYVPASLLYAAFLLHTEADYPLPEATATVTANPAHMAQLHDRGELVTGRRADFVHVHQDNGLPIAKAVWNQARRVA